MVSTKISPETHKWTLLGPFNATFEPISDMTIHHKTDTQLNVDVRIKLPLWATISVGSLIHENITNTRYQVAYARKFDDHIDLACTRILSDVNSDAETILQAIIE